MQKRFPKFWYRRKNPLDRKTFTYITLNVSKTFFSEKYNNRCRKQGLCI